MMDEEKTTTLEFETFSILTAAIRSLQKLRERDEEKFLQYAPGVHHMCVEFLSTPECNGD